MSYYCENLNQNPNSLFTNNNNNSSSMDPQVNGCSSKGHEDRSSEDHSNLNDENGGADSENSENSDEMFVNSYDAEVSEDDVQLSSPSNSDVDQRWYAFRGRFVDIHNDNRLPLNNQLPELPQPQQEEEDFLEMDFEPETNSEIENEAKFSDYVLPNGHHPGAALHFHNHPQPEFLVQPKPNREDPGNLIRPVTNKNTGAKPKQLSVNNRPQKPRHVSDGDNVFKISTNLNNNFINSASSHCRPSTTNEVYNLGASSSRSSYHNPHSCDILKIHKSPSKSSNHHHNHKHLRLHEEQNDQFLFEIEPLKPRNSVTIYTTNCDEKVLLDALVKHFRIM